VLVIVGHGPSVLKRPLGSWLDTQTVVRLKSAPMPDKAYWGSRTDYLAGTGIDWRVEFHKTHKAKPPFWLWDKHGAFRHIVNHPTMRQKRSHVLDENIYFTDIDRWSNYFNEFKPEKPKPSTGLTAIFAAVEQGFEEIALLGFDSFFTDKVTGKWNVDPKLAIWGHDQLAEQRALQGLGIKVIDASVH
jgi:hypothetical protein